MAKRLLWFVLVIFFARPAWGSDPAGSTVTLEWDAGPEPDLAGYYIYRSQSSGSGYTRVNPQPHPNTRFTDVGLEAGGTYYYVCSAVSESGLESGFSNEVSVIVAAAPAPSAADDVVTLLEDQAVVIDPLANDTAGDGSQLSLQSVTQPQFGVVIATGDLLRYVPPLNFYGVEHFGYVAANATGVTATAVVEVRVTPVNDLPEARPDQVSVEAGQAVFVEPLVNDRDPDGDLLTLESITILQGSASHDESRIHYTPPPDFTGIETIGYTIHDGNGGRATASIRVKVDLENRPPVPGDDWSWTLRGEGVAIAVLSNDSDPDGDLLELADWSSPEGGRLTGAGVGVLRFVPDPDFVGIAEFNYTVSDGEDEAIGLVSIDVREQPADDLIFPGSFTLGSGAEAVYDTAVGIAVLNPQADSTSVTFRGLGADGTLVSEQSLQPLASRGQQAFLSSELGAPAAGAASLIVQADKQLKGLVTLGDTALTRLDALGGRPHSGRRLYLHQTSVAPGGALLIRLFNPSSFAADVTLRLHSADGTMIAEASRELAPLGTEIVTAKELFGGFDAFQEGYIVLDANVVIQAQAVRARPDSLIAEGAMRAVASNALIAPHFYINREAGDVSRLRLLNPGGATVRIRIEAFGPDAESLAAISFNFQPGELLAEDLDHLLELSPSAGSSVSGYLRIGVDSFLGGTPAVIGSMEFSGFGGRAATSLALANVGHEHSLFPHVAQLNGSVFTGVALVNTFEQTARVTVRAYSRAGALTATRDIELAAGRRIVELLDSEQLFGPGFEQVGGHFEVLSETPVVSMAIFGSPVGGFLSALQAQKYSLSQP